MFIWHFDGRGCWEADSHRAPEHFEHAATWRIVVCEDGTFTVNETDDLLLSIKRHDERFTTLASARQWCENQEGRI